MNNFREWAQLLSGWKAVRWTFLMGMLSALAFAPFFAVPVLLFAMPFLVWRLSEAQNYKQAFKTGWWFGFGYFVGGCYWIVNSLLLDAMFWWLIPFALIGLNGLLAIHIGLVGLLAHAAQKYGERWHALAFAAAWLLLEFARSHWFTGFPWNLIGYSLAFSAETIQLAAYGGIYLLSAVVLIWALSLVWVSCSFIKAIAINVVIVLNVVGLGQSLILTGYSEYDEEIRIRLIQPNTPQALKWDEQSRADNLVKLVELTVQDGLDDIDLVIWPESSVPYALNGGAGWPQMFREFLPESTLLLAGVNREQREPLQVWNSIAVFDHNGAVVEYYDKHHLVPFGEYIPLRNMLPMDKITPGAIDFSRGDIPQPFVDKRLRGMLPLICYEAIFPSLSNNNDARWLLNISNDGWFGFSSGPWQHHVMARVRAVEQGVPVVRLSNRGPSAVWDGFGRKIISTDFYKTQSVDILLTIPRMGR